MARKGKLMRVLLLLLLLSCGTDEYELDTVPVTVEELEEEEEDEGETVVHIGRADYNPPPIDVSVNRISPYRNYRLRKQVWGKR